VVVVKVLVPVFTDRDVVSDSPRKEYASDAAARSSASCCRERALTAAPAPALLVP
jgi:hypothetical protein